MIVTFEVIYSRSHDFLRHQNTDLSPEVADQFWIIKETEKSILTGSVESETKTFVSQTKEPVFADNERGVRAAAFNAEMLRRKSRHMDVLSGGSQ